MASAQQMSEEELATVPLEMSATMATTSEQEEEQIVHENLLPNHESVPLAMEHKKYSIWKIILFCLFNVGNMMTAWYSVNVLLPLQVIEFVGHQQKSNVLAIVGLTVSLFTIPAGPLSGYISDHLITKFGKRKPFLIAGFLCKYDFVLFHLYFAQHYQCACKIVFANESHCTICNQCRICHHWKNWICIDECCIFGTNIGHLSSITIGPSWWHVCMIPILTKNSNGFVSLLSAGLGISLLAYLYSIVLQ